MLERTSGAHMYTAQQLAERTHLHALCSVPVSSSTIIPKFKLSVWPNGFMPLLRLSKGMVICMVAHSKRVNRVNGFHSFIKERLLAARGVVTIYLNRYNALFSQVFSNRDIAADKIFELMTTRNGSFSDISSVKSQFLLIL